MVAVPSAEAVAAHLAKPNKIESLNLAEASAHTTPGTTASEQNKFETTLLFVGYVGMGTDLVTLGRLTMFAQQIQPHPLHPRIGHATLFAAKH